METALIRLGRQIASIFLPVLMLFGGVGCMKYEKAQVAPYAFGNEESKATIQRTGVYSVRWADRPGGALQAMDGTDVLLSTGDPAGFETDEDGNIVAVSGPRHLVLDKLPPKAKYVVWYHNVRAKTQFGKEVDKALATTGRVLVTTGEVVLIGGLLVGTAMLNDDDSYCQCGSHCHCGGCRCYH